MNQAVARRHILFLIPTLTAGGAERVTITLLRHLNRNRYKLTLAVVDMRNEVFRNDVPDDVNLVDLGCSRVRYALPKIVTLIWKLRPDVVFSTLGHLNLMLAVSRPILPRNSLYIARETIIVSQGIQQYVNHWLWRWMYVRFYGAHDLVVCQSQDMLDDLVDNFSLQSTKTQLIHNPVDIERIRTMSFEPLSEIEALKIDHNSREVQLVAAGRLVEQKGFDLAIEALAQLRHPLVRLTILGDGPLRKSLEQLAANRGVADKVRFVGYQANPYAWFRWADAFLLSSRYEGFPNVVLEALACSRPIISTPAPGGVHEILSGIPNCIVAKSISVEALSDAMKRWLVSDKVSLTEDTVAPYQVSIIVGRYEMLFDSVKADCKR